MKKKIAIVGTRGIPATYGGVEKHCEDLYTALAKQGYDITIFTRSYYNDRYTNEYKGVKIKNIFTPNIKGLETFFHSFICTILATFSDYDILHFQSQGPALFSFIPRLFSPRKKIAFTCHGLDWQRDKWNILAKIIIMLGEKASAYFSNERIMVSKALQNHYKSKYKINSTLIYNAVSIPKNKAFTDIDKKFSLKEKDYFLFVGRLVPEKAPDILIKAFKEVKTNKKLVIVGGDAGSKEYFDELQNIAKDDNRIVFTDYLYGDDLKEIYSNGFAFISASKLEGLPLTLLEAMSYGLPSAISDIAPHNEVAQLLKGNIISFKVNEIKSCTNALNKLIAMDEKNLTNMRISSKQAIFDHFSLTNFVSLYDKVYLKLLN